MTTEKAGKTKQVPLLHVDAAITSALHGDGHADAGPPPDVGHGEVELAVDQPAEL